MSLTDQRWAEDVEPTRAWHDWHGEWNYTLNPAKAA